ncbi:MAG: peptide chain release factor N(5)-glutamine methyltransferase [Chloroflexi bacterium]|nr:peptide chain release factor N(5)-glutamine methyltransferase [Chloroflexota bacterium]
MKVRELLLQITQLLSDNQTPDSHIEAEVLLRHILGMERAEFFAALAEHLSSHQCDQVRNLAKRRLDGEPLAYITGHREFYGLDFVVNPHVLIPRQETELLVECVLEHCSRPQATKDLRIADIGTGSGAIAIAIAANLPHAQLYATDCDPNALAVAEINCRKHGLEDRVRLSQGDLLDALEAPVDVIVSNPPYITTAEIPLLAPEVRREPNHALDGGPDGLNVIRRLYRQTPAFIRDGGCILVEIAPEQLESVMQLGREEFSNAEISFRRDMLGLPRVVIVSLQSTKH